MQNLLLRESIILAVFGAQSITQMLTDERINTRFIRLSSPPLTLTPTVYLEICLLSNNILDYHIVAQGKTTIPGLDDGEELTFTDVRHYRRLLWSITLPLPFELIE